MLPTLKEVITHTLICTVGDYFFFLLVKEAQEGFFCLLLTKKEA